MNAKLQAMGFGLAVAVVLASCAKAPSVPPPPAEVTVRTAVAVAEPVRRIRTYPGIAQSVHSVAISARVAGFLEKQHAKDGATVKAGELLFTIDERPFVAQLSSARATLAQTEAQVPAAQAALEQSQRDVERNEPLASAGGVSKQSFDQMKTKVSQSDAQLTAAKAAVVAARAQVEIAELNLSYCRITAPCDGVIGKAAASEGQMVGPGYTVQLNQLVQMNPMWVEFSPSATEWPLVKERMDQGEVKATIVYGGVETLQATGVVTFASNVVNAQTSTITLRVTFDNASNAFKPGTFCNVKLDLGEIPGVVMVPTRALVARETDFYVWRVKQDQTVENLRVVASIREEERVGIVEGIAAGDRVVVAGTQKLRAGSKVKEEQAAK